MEIAASAGSPVSRSARRRIEVAETGFSHSTGSAFKAFNGG